MSVAQPSRFGQDIIGLALAEDLGSGDATTRYFPLRRGPVTARIVARQSCVLAGGPTALGVFRRVSDQIEASGLLPEGAQVTAQDAVLRLRGPAEALVAAERTALNFLQRLSGVATLTRAYVDAIAGTQARILDTRKTTPGFRELEKSAVRAGGGTNHRMSLGDMILVKDNHLAASRGIPALQEGIRRAKSRGLSVEVEVDTLDQLVEALRLDGVDILLLDNMPPPLLAQAVAMRKPGVLLEASGGITLHNVRAIAETGVDRISIGALTHSAPAADFGLDFEEHNEP